VTAQPVDTADGDDGAADDVASVPHRRLRSTLEFAVAVAAEASRQGIAVPEGLADLANRPRLGNLELGRARRAVVAAPMFRNQVAEAAGAAPDVVDDLGHVWLARPPGWRERLATLVELESERERRTEAEQALRREQKRRESAERKRSNVESEVGRRDLRAEALTEQVAALQAMLEEARAAVERARAELVERAASDRRARDRQAEALRDRDAAVAAREAAEQRALAAEGARDRLLAERADTSGRFSGSALADLRTISEQLTRVAAEVRAVVMPPAAKRVPIAVSGSVLGDPRATAELLMRADARVLIDGYNVAKLMWPEAALSEQRTRLLDAVDNVIRRYGSDVVVVFDGADVVGARADRRRLSRVSYSPAGVSADDMIRDEVKGTPAQRSVVVVTDDREIQRDVARHGTNVLPSSAFAALALA
jgi:hypothetical protein